MKKHPGQAGVIKEEKHMSNICGTDSSTSYEVIATRPSVSIQTCAPQDNGLSGEYTTLDGPKISTSRA